MMGRLRMRIIVLRAIVAVTLVGFPHPIAAQAGTSSCLAPDDTSARIVAHVKFILTDTSQASARTRDSLGITGVQPSQVVSVTNSQACSKIVAFFDHFEGVIRSRRRVYAYSIGPTTLVAQDPNFKSGQWTPLMFLNGTYKLIQSHMVF